MKNWIWVEGVRVEIDPSPKEIVDELSQLLDEDSNQDREIYGIVLGISSYMTLREHLSAMCSWRDRLPGSAMILHYNGIKIFMDPTRQAGAPVVLYDERNAFSKLVGVVR